MKPKAEKVITKDSSQAEEEEQTDPHDYDDYGAIVESSKPKSEWPPCLDTHSGATEENKNLPTRLLLQGLHKPLWYENYTPCKSNHKTAYIVVYKANNKYYPLSRIDGKNDKAFEGQNIHETTDIQTTYPKGFHCFLRIKGAREMMYASLGERYIFLIKGTHEETIYDGKKFTIVRLSVEDIRSKVDCLIDFNKFSGIVVGKMTILGETEDCYEEYRVSER